MPHVRVIRRPHGLHGHWVPLDEFTVPLPVSLALHFIPPESTYCTSTSSIAATTGGVVRTCSGACNVGFDINV